MITKEQEVRVEIRPAGFFQQLDANIALPIPSFIRSHMQAGECECGAAMPPPTHVSIFTGALYTEEHDCDIPV